MIILDFFKAFDTVPHGKLLHKMKLYGVDGNINAWLCDFLTNRKMKVVVNGEESESVTMESGTRPQGTVLGPLLFLCHINDLPDAPCPQEGPSTIRDMGSHMGNAFQLQEMLL